jgi:hypothetical protein
MKTCGQCEHFYWVPDEVRKNAGIPQSAPVGFCYGHPPSVQVIPVPVERGLMLGQNGQQAMRLQQQNMRAVMLDVEKACSLWEPANIKPPHQSN